VNFNNLQIFNIMSHGIKQRAKSGLPLSPYNGGNGEASWQQQQQQQKMIAQNL
jgi:hypothetical protein